MRILLTGFPRFHRWRTNPTETLVRDLTSSPPPGVLLEGQLLPVSYRRAPEQLRELLGNGGWDALLMLGLAPRPMALRIERFAVNLADATIPDEDGDLRRDQPLEPDGPAAYQPRFPVVGAVEALERADIPVVRSLSAGAFVCNALMYGAAHWLERTGRELPYGFVHVPPTEAEARESREGMLPYGTVRRGVEVILELLRQDLERQGEPRPR